MMIGVAVSTRVVHPAARCHICTSYTCYKINSMLCSLVYHLLWLTLVARKTGYILPHAFFDSFAVYMILHLFELSCVRASIVKSSCDIWKHILECVS
jgi:hypothetical protein